MMQAYSVTPVAHIRTDFPTKFGIPRQSGVDDELRGTVIFEPKYRDEAATRGLEGFSHIWILWLFSENTEEETSLTVRPPRLGGNKRVGVFASRSPFRPNRIGLSCVRLLCVRQADGLGTVLDVCGADMMDGTPILDIKPYLPYTDSIENAVAGYVPQGKEAMLEVEFPKELLHKLPEEKRKAACLMLSQDPRPQYIANSTRQFGVMFAGFDIRFSVEGKCLTVKQVLKADDIKSSKAE